MREIVGVRLPHLHSGKVRELFECEAGLLMVASDRLSAFDVILDQGVPGKGILLTQLSRFWFCQIERNDLSAHHLLPDQEACLEETLGKGSPLIPRSLVVRRLNPVPIEAVVRGYLSGSGWKTYRETGCLWDVPAPSGLLESEQLPEPVFTPSTKAVSGHDEPLSRRDGIDLVGKEVFEQVEELSLSLYRFGAMRAQDAGMILADTKFEFGLDDSGRLVLMDEALTPDSSRFWPAAGYVPGAAQPSFDKQFIRDYLESCSWDKAPPPPEIPPEIVRRTQELYREAFYRLTETSGPERD